MEAWIKISCLALLAIGVQTSVLPVEKCTLSDKDCMLTAFQKMLPIFVAGMPEYGVELMDPLKMGDTKFDLSGLQFSLAEGTLKGLKNAVIDSVEWGSKKFNFGFHFDALLKGHYTAAGRVLILPITGDGQMKLKLKNIVVKIVIHFKMEKKDDKDYMKCSKYGVDFDVKDNANFHLTNLFNGNKELSDTMLTFLNDNWKQVSMEFGTPLVNSAAKEIYKNICQFLESSPIADIANV